MIQYLWKGNGSESFVDVLSWNQNHAKGSLAETGKLSA